MNLNSEEIVHRTNDEAGEHDDFKEPVQKADFLISSSNPVKGVAEAIKRINRIAGQESSNGYLYTAVINTLHHSVSAARLYAALTKPGAAPLSISMSWPTIFKTRQAYDDALKNYPDILKSTSGEPLPNENIDSDMYRATPVSGHLFQPSTTIFPDSLRQGFLRIDSGPEAERGHRFQARSPSAKTG